MVVPDAWSDATAAEGLLGVNLCDDHLAEQLTMPIVRNAEMERLLGMMADPQTEPDFPEAYLEGVPLGSPEHRAFMAMRAN